MMVGHRWEYDYDLRLYYCASLPLGGVESHQWCVGCGCRIRDLELRETVGKVEGLFLHPFLNMLAEGRGYKPIEAGTFAEYKLRQRQGVLA